MPGNEAEKLSGPQDESINFRSSPNFKHMKKYLKSKFEKMNAAAASNAKPEPSNDDRDQSEPEKVMKVETAIQPPLPPNPPPPDSPPAKIKQEIVDDEYQCNNAVDSSDLNQSEQAFIPVTNQPSTSKPEPIMCRNFVRGTCRKGSACIFAHELILSQLEGVYTFCNNFQNKQCIHAKCKFVHATVFEKEHFFRTGFLPPHTTKHMRPNVAPPPPPPPPPPPEEPIQPVAQVYPTAPVFDPSVAPVPVMTCASAPPAVNVNVGDVFNVGVPNSATSAIRQWGEDFVPVVPVSQPPQQLKTVEPLPKKCKDCDTNEFRYQYMKNKVEKMCLGSQERNQQIAQLNKKYERLCTVLMTFFKPGSSSSSLLGTSLFNIGGEKEQSFMEQMNSVLSTNNLTLSPFMADESTKNFLSGLKF